MGSERGLTNAVPNHSYPQRLLCVLRGQLLDIAQDNPVFRFEFLDCSGEDLRISVSACSRFGLGLQSSDSLGIRSLSPCSGASRENYLGPRLRRCINASFTAIRTTHV